MICQGYSQHQCHLLYRDVVRDRDTEALRRLCCEDLYFLLHTGFQRKDIADPWLFDRCREVEASPDGHLDLWAREHYKDLDCDTPVLTRDGWKTHGTLAAGDEVATPDGRWTEVLATRRFTDSACRELDFRGGAKIVAGAGHLWRVELSSKPRKKGGGRSRTWTSTLVRTDDLPKLCRIPVATTVPLHQRRLPIDPYVLGVWLGDGATDSGRVTGEDDAVFAEVASRGFRLSHNHRKDHIQTRTVYGLQPRLRRLGVLGSKHIPLAYLTASRTDRLDLMRGLMDTDGSQARKQGSTQAVFAQKSTRLAHDMTTLAATLGWKPRLTPAHTTSSWHVCFATGIGEPSPFLLQRKTDRIPLRERGVVSQNWYLKRVTRVETRPTNCIQVADPAGMYLVGRQLIATHNSTIITFAKSIQDILRDPEVTIGIFSHIRPLAKSFLSQIKRELEENVFLKDLFPDILYAEPKRESPCWSLDNGIVVKRKTNPAAATVEAYGLVDGQPTGKHFAILVYDDVVTLASVTTPEQIEKTTQAWEMSLNLGVKGGRRRHIGTRYHYNDTYKTIQERRSAQPRIHKATTDGTPTGEPVFLTREQLREKRTDMGPYVFGSQMLQDPTADAAMNFREEWLRYYLKDPDLASMNVYITVDPAHSKKKGSDYTVMLVVALGQDRNYYIIDGVRDRLNLTQRTSKLFDLCRQYDPIKVGYERYGLQSDIEHIQDKMEQENYRFTIQELGGQTSKFDRIMSLVPKFEAGRIWMPIRLLFGDYEGKVHDFVQEFINDEYLAYPVPLHDDMLDDLARILDPEFKAIFPGAPTRDKRRRARTQTNRAYKVL